jgi:hypothetical protein
MVFLRLDHVSLIGIEMITVHREFAAAINQFGELHGASDRGRICPKAVPQFSLICSHNHQHGMLNWTKICCQLSLYEVGRKKL